MRNITSSDNGTYKKALKLLRKKYRDEMGMYLLEGVKPVADAIDAGTDIETVIIREGSGVGITADHGCNTAVMSSRLFERLSDTETSQGVIAIAAKRQCEDLPGRGNAVILDRLRDPGNIGTIIRTAEAAGFDAVIAVKGTGDVYSPKVVRAAAGSLLRMAVMEGVETEEAIEICRRRGRKIVATTLTDAVDYRDADMSGGAAIVIGNEGSGVSSKFIEAADVKVRIPMKGEIESLNAAVAAGVLMYECERQAAAAGKVK